MKALYPGTFDPVTNGHMDIIVRGLCIFDEVVVAVSDHGRKDTMFDVKTRCGFIENFWADEPRVRVVPFTNLAVDCALKQDVHAIIRGLRVTSDFEYEFIMAKFMAEQNRNIQPVYLMADARLTHISSTAVREIASLGGDISAYVPEVVVDAIVEKNKKDIIVAA